MRAYDMIHGGLATASLTALILSTAHCGSSEKPAANPSDAGGDDANGGGHSDAGGGVTTGAINVFVGTSSDFAAAFTTVTAYTETDTTISANVTVRTYAGDVLAAPQSLNAGIVTITGGATPVAMPFPYRASINGPYATTGTLLTSSWAGGTGVGAGSASAKVPGTVAWATPVSPAAGATISVPENADLVATWTLGTALPDSIVHVLLADSGSASLSHVVIGDFKASAQTGTIPAAALGHLAKGPGIFQVSMQQASTTVIGGAPVTMTVSMRTGFVASAGASFQ